MSKPITGKTTTSVWKQKRKNGDIYVWERQTVYIPETRKTKELSRKLLGKIPAGSTDGEIVPTRPKRKKTEDAVPQSSTRSRIGSSSLLRWVGEQSGITDDLLSCMDEGSAKKVDTVAQFWLANQGDRLQRMQKWQFLHPTPYPEPISKDVYHDLFEYLGLNEGIVQNYFLARAKRCHKEDAVAFDSSTVSSYSRYIKETRQGFNKAGDGLDTVKLLTLFDLATHQPIAFAREPGNLADVSGIENALKQFSFLNISKAQIVTDKGYYTNSYHVDVREKIDAFTKLGFEAELQKLSTGGAISYIEVPNMEHNLDAMEEVVRFIYDNVQYGEFNTKSDYCHECGFSGEIKLNKEGIWECPNCGNKDKHKMNVTRRTCGYLGENFWNEGKTKEIGQRVTHL